MVTAATREVGRIMVNFAELEWSLAGAISGLVAPELADEQMLVVEVPFIKKCALFNGLCQRKLADAPRKSKVELQSLVSQLLQCRTSRKQASHPLWLRRTRDRDGERTRTARLKSVADELVKTTDSLGVFMDRHFGKSDHREDHQQ